MSFVKPGMDGNGGSPALVRDRTTWLTGVILIGLAALAWAAVFVQAQAMVRPAATADASMGMSGAAPTTPAGTFGAGAALAFVFAWGVMMTAMMLPSATPMIALYGTVRRNLAKAGRAGIPTALFALVYLVLWLATGIPVYLVGRLVNTAAGMNPAVASALPYALAVTLIGAGVYQFTPLKRACLRVCSSPLSFLMGRWRAGPAGTFQMALEHAGNCIGCCWALMVVLVAAGAMSLPWVLSLAALVFIEKIVPRGELTARIAGVVLVALGLLVFARPDLAAVLRGQGM